MENFKVIPSHSATGDETATVNSSITNAVAKEKKLIRCDLCGRTVNSETQAEAHVRGLYHLSRMQARGLPLPPETDLDKLRQYNAKAMRAMKSTPVRQPVGSPNFYSRRGPAPFDIHIPEMGMSMSAMPPTAMPPPVNSNYTMTPAYNPSAPAQSVLCEICGVTANSPTQAQSHLNGRKHLTRLAELGMPVPQDVAVDFLEATSLSMRQSRTNFEATKMQMRFAHRVPQQFPTPRFQYLQPHGPRMFNFRSANTMMNAPFHNGPATGPRSSTYQVRVRTLIPCETCQLLFNSQGQAQAHFNGSKHQKKLRMVSYYQKNVEKVHNPGSSIKQIVCPVCSTSVNSDKQMDAHVQGKLHKSKLEQKLTLDENEDKVVQDNVEVKGAAIEESTANKTNSVYDLANFVPGSSLNPGIYGQQHFASSELDGSSMAACAAKQSV